MGMQKGICIELKENRSIFLLSDGKFVFGSPVKEAVVGEEVYFYPAALKTSQKFRLKPVWAPVIAVMAVAALFFSALFPTQGAYAYVQVQINPGIELGIDKDYKVVSIRNLNADGKELIEELGVWKEEPLDEVLNRVMKLSITDSIKEVVITTVDDDVQDETEKEIEKMLLAVPSSVLREDIVVKLKEATIEQRQKSLEESIPVGRLVKKSTEIEKEAKEEKNPDPIKLPEKAKQKKAPPEKEKNEKQAEDKVKKKPENPGKRGEAPGKNKKKNSPPGLEKKKEAPKQNKEKNKEKFKEKNNEKNNGENNGKHKEKVKPPGQEKRHEVPGQQKDKNKHPGKGEKKHAPGQNKDKKSPPGQSKNDNAPGQSKKNHPKRE